MAGPYLWLRGELGPAVEEAWGTTVGWYGTDLISRNSPVAGRNISPIGRV